LASFSTKRGEFHEVKEAVELVEAYVPISGKHSGSPSFIAVSVPYWSFLFFYLFFLIFLFIDCRRMVVWWVGVL